MSSVCILTPVVIGAWPAVAAAVASVAATMGFTVQVPETVEALAPDRTRTRVETEVPNSEVLADEMAVNEKIVISQGSLEIVITRDDRGAINLCVTGEGHGKRELERIGQEVAGRIVQQYAYHKLITELKARNYNVLEESMQRDQSIQLKVQLRP